MMRTPTLPAAVLRRGLLAGAVVTTTILLSACGGGDTSSSDAGPNHGGMMGASSAPAGSAAFNDADVSFAQSMIPHHQQAIQMAAMAAGRASNAQVKDLAGKIRAAQQPEIDTMNGWLTTWGAPTPMPGMSMGSGMGHDSMPGMMSATDMGTLTAMTGASFDKRFLTMMISHHEGAVEMARQETAQGSDPDAIALAKKIITDQQAEITTMKSLLAQL